MFNKKAVPLIDDGEGTYFFKTENPSPVPLCHIQEVQNSEEFFIASVLKTETKFTLNNIVFPRTENLGRP
jgi:hypothetical protein